MHPTAAALIDVSRLAACAAQARQLTNAQKRALMDCAEDNGWGLLAEYLARWVEEKPTRADLERLTDE